MPGEQPSGADALYRQLRSPGYLKLLLLSGLLGVPVSLAAFGFVALEHAAQNGVWEHLPHAAGFASVPWWWPLPALLVGGVVVAWAVTRLPGRGGHLPVQGVGGEPILPSALPGVVLAALATLSAGAVLGPEAPLMALGGGLALLTVRAAHRAETPQLTAVLSTAGAAAAIATIFGSPLVAAVMLIEAVGLGGPQLFLLILPCLLSSGVGALVFTGFGHWTGLSIGALALPTVPPDQLPNAADFLWGVPLAALIACGVVALMTLGSRVGGWTAERTARRTVACALAVGACIAGYALITGRSPEEAALSGQKAMADLAADPSGWPVHVLVLLLLFKGLAWGVSLGSLRGGPVFPALFLGAAAGVACAALPGFAAAPALAAGMAAGGAAGLRLPVTAIVLTVLLIGPDAVDQMPLVIIAAVVAFVTGELLRGRLGHPPAGGGLR
ncbi:chloride channel protein [Kitasatospora kazusensis]|uniref:Chloride channel protein n=1 Tax=Kitasatospora kazusensis TaxID=407974 RepID=A0ABN3A442_9ACTN